MSERSIGQIAFESYNASKGGVTYDGRPIPPWDMVGAEVQRVGDIERWLQRS